MSDHRLARGLLALATLVATAALAPSAAFAQSTTTPNGTCEKRVAFGLVEATTDGCLTSVADQRWESTDTVRLNSLPLPVAPGTKLVLTGPTSQRPGGTLSVTTNISVRGVTLHQGALSVDLPAGTRGGEQPLVTLSPPSNQRLFGFKVTGSAELRLGYGTDEQRYSLFKIVLGLPDVFKNGPGQGAGGVTTTVGVRVDSRGARTDAVKGVLEHVYVGQLEIKELCLSYVEAGGTTTTPCEPPRFGAQPLLTCESGGSVDRWDGSATIVLPTQAKPEIGLFAGTKSGEFSYAGGQAGNLGTSAALAPGVYLDKVGLAICVNPPPLRLKGAAGIRFGPEFRGSQAAYLDASVEYTNSVPWTIRADGSMSLFNRNVGGGYFLYKSTNAIDFGFNAAFNFYGIFSTSARVDGWLAPEHTGPWFFGRTRTFPTAFNVDGNGRMCVVVSCMSGETTVSTVGAAGCFTLVNFTYYVLVKDSNWHWYYPWRVHFEKRTFRLRAGGGFTWSTSHLDVLGDSCDVGSYRAIRFARNAQSGVTTVKIPEEPAVALRIHGRTAAPEVELIAPDGRRIVSPDTDSHHEPGSHAFAEDDRTKTSSVVIGKPKAGTWRIRPLPGSSPIVRVEQAETREPATIVGGVSRRSGGRYVLGYAYEAHDDNLITFVERGVRTHKGLGSSTAKPCRGEPDGPSDRGVPVCGHLPFRPAVGPAGVRRIYAIIHEDGHPFDEELVTTYRVKGDPRPRPSRSLRLQRRGRNILVRWADARHADHWNVRVYLGDGQRQVHVHRGETERETIRDVSPRTRVRVVVVGLRNHDHAEGRALQATLRPRQAAARSR